jgi:hypothetical protein
MPALEARSRPLTPLRLGGGVSEEWGGGEGGEVLGDYVCDLCVWQGGGAARVDEGLEVGSAAGDEDCDVVFGLRHGFVYVVCGRGFVGCGGKLGNLLSTEVETLIAVLQKVWWDVG